MIGFVVKEIAGLYAHLLQSTLFAGVAWLLTLGLQKNPAKARHAVLFIASIKFLIPFSTLVGLGTLIPRHASAPLIQSTWVATVEQISQPLMTLPVVASNESGHDYLTAAAIALWACGFAAITIIWLRRWKRVHAIRKSATPANMSFVVPVMSAPDLIEPGIVGIVRPILLLPEGIENRLDPAQLDAILAHELCHVRRRDNLTATIHMAVQAIFWFHPLVWWLGVRLVEERERACDEEVLRLGAKPQIYAAGILSVCKLYVESPLPCVSGVTGSNLKKRIETIMKSWAVQRLNFIRRAILIATGVAAVAVPVTVGFLKVPSVRAQSAQSNAPRPKFDAASIKRDVSGEGGGIFTCVPNCHLERMTLKDLVIFAYRLHDFQVTGGPGWIDSDRYNIDAKAEGPPSLNQEYVTLQSQRLQTLLRDRFNLTIHRETKELPVYELTVAKRGPKLQTPNCLQRKSGDFTIAPGKYCGLIGGSMASGRLQASSTTMANLARFLSSMLSRTVVDKTGITGEFDLQLTFTPDRPNVPSSDLPGPRPADTAGAADLGPNIFTAIQEQLGLALESAKGPVEILVIDHVERPSEN